MKIKTLILPFVLATVVILAVVYIALRKESSANQSSSKREISINQMAVSRQEGNPWVNGNPKAKVVLLEYSDFQCPACASWQQVIELILNKFDGQLRFEFRHFPLESIHDKAFRAALAVEAAGRQGKFWQMHDLLFKNQDKWSENIGIEGTIKQYARDLGLNVDLFTRDFKDPQIKKIVKSDIDLGNKLRITGTPTLFLNNKEIKPKSVEDFENIIQNAIDAAGQKER